MKKTIKILGTGCPKCKATTSVVQEVVKEKNIDAEIVKVEDMVKIMEYNVMSTPAVVVDEEVKIRGHVPSRKEVEKILL